MIKCKVKKDVLKVSGMIVYTGFITVYHNNKYLWSKFSGITRINKEDAMQDAINLKNQ